MRRRVFRSHRRRSMSGSARRRLCLEALEARRVLAAPDLDLSAVATQTAEVGETLHFDLFSAGATVQDDETAQADIRLQLDPDVPDQTPEGASLTPFGFFSWTPTQAQIGMHTLVVIAVDDGSPAEADAETFTIEVIEAPNNPPSFTLSAGDTVLEDAGLQTVADFATNIDPGAAGESGQTLTFNITDNTNPGVFATAPAIAADGTLTYEAAADANGTATITVELMDDGGTANGGDDTSDPQTFTISVTAVNDEPSFTIAASDAVAVDSGPQSVANFADNISPGPADESGQTLTFNITDNTNSALFSEGPAISSDGTLTYTPAASTSGTATITVELMDDGGTVDGGDDTSDPQTFVINVGQPPQLTLPAPFDNPAAPVTVERGEPLTFQASATDPDGLPDGSDLTFDVDTDGSGLSGGAALPTIDGDGVLTWTPDENGTFSINVIVTDADGLADQETFSVTVVDPNQPPELTLPSPFDDPATPVDVDEGTQVTFTATATDPDGDPGGGDLVFQLDLDGSGLPQGAAEPTISTTGVFDWTPDAVGQFTIRVLVIDAGGKADQEQFTVNVNSAAQAAPQLAAQLGSPPADDDRGNDTLFGDEDELLTLLEAAL